MTTEQVLICGKTCEEIQQLKAQKGALVLVEVNSEGKKYQAIFKEPSFQTLEAINKISKTDEMKGLQAAYHNCLVVCDPEIQERDLLKIKAVEGLMVRVQKITSQAKNL